MRIRKVVGHHLGDLLIVFESLESSLFCLVSSSSLAVRDQRGITLLRDYVQRL